MRQNVFTWVHNLNADERRRHDATGFAGIVIDQCHKAPVGAA